MIQLLEQEVSPRIFFRPLAMQKMKAMVEYTETECALEGTVYINDDGEYIIEDVFAYPQTVTGATVEMDKDRYAEWLDVLSDETLIHKRFQMHSHVNMGVTPSVTDTECYKNYMDNCTDFMIFMIMNKKNEYNIWLYDKANNLMYDKASLDVGVLFNDDTSDYDWYAEEVLPKMHKPTPTFTAGPKVTARVADKTYKYEDYDYYGGMLYGGNKYLGSY